MWIMTNFGFFSVVQKPGDIVDGFLTVRARQKEDLESLIIRYWSETEWLKYCNIEENEGTDYKYRVRVPKEAVSYAMKRAVEDIDYDNFKDSVTREQGYERSRIYHDVWCDLYNIQYSKQNLDSYHTIEENDRFELSKKMAEPIENLTGEMNND